MTAPGGAGRLDGAGGTGAEGAASAEIGVRTACPYCGVGCGVIASPDGKGGAAIRGDKDHPANYGRLCSKGSALGETIDMADRLLTPKVGGRDASWDAAIGLVAEKFQAAIRDHGPDSVAFYVSGQLLTEDYYVANKLMKGWIGSGNIDTNSRLCMASSVAGMKRAFGADSVPQAYEDLEETDLLVLVGSNLAWAHPVLYQRVIAAKAARPGMKVITIDPRRTASSDLADLHLPIRPGSDVALWNAVLSQVIEQGAVDAAYVAAHVDGFAEAAAEVRGTTAANAAAACGLDAADVETFINLWVRTEKVVTIWSQGVNQSSAGTDKVNAIINCHLATGRIGKPGSGPFSVTGQPNAMGGREVGGLANMLAAHLDIENAAHREAVQGFWASPAIPTKPGLKAVDLFEACRSGKIKALWIMSTNPAVSLPDADGVREAIAACDFVAVSDIIETTDTTRLADVLLPATGWGEKSGTVTNSDRTISRQRPFLPAPGKARADWKIICDVAQAMGFDGFDFEDEAAVYREHAALSGVAGKLGRDFDISDHAGLSREGYDGMAPFRWPLAGPRKGGRFFADGKFFTPSGKGRMLALELREPAQQLTAARPLRLNTGRARDHWHTMTRTAKSPRLSQHMGEPWLEVHPEDAAACGLKPADLAEVSSDRGTSILRVLVTDKTRPGVLFAPMHWTGEYAPTGRVCALPEPVVDPVSGQPELKSAAVSARRFRAAWHGFAAARGEFRPKTAYWSRARTKTGWRAELAHDAAPADWENFARDLFGLPHAATACVIDAARGIARVALLVEDRVAAVLFAAPEPVQVARGHVVAALDGDGPALPLLAGRPGADMPDPGAIVCACFDVGVNTILAAIAGQGLTSVEAVGDVLRAGTNCGSCRPEIRAILDGAIAARKEAAE
ncbi:molybdopterin-dependent oxidoreductase [Rhodovulum sp. DZ06]|uniref:molybdopterin-dependent oxidoreductase n=1 Tax=Rhodovulum sp. DZ06 TaxID=3425126 RepID=UPI003D356D4C